MKYFVLVTLVFVFVVSFLAGPAAASDQDLERDALVALYHSTNGDSWSRNDNWLDESIPHCDWFGVACDGEGHVQSLNLEDNQLSGYIPPELGNLSSLTYLNLGVNQLNGSIPSELGSLSSLTYLRLGWNQLNGSIPLELSNLSGLTYLDLAVNQLNGPIPPELGKLSSLTYFDLGWNQLSGFIPPELGNLTNLGDLRLYANKLSGSIPHELGNLSHLFFLELYGNQLSGPIPLELGNLSNTEWLRLHDNQLTCWETEGVLSWAMNVPHREWDYPNPGEVVCPCQALPGNIVQNSCFEEGEAPWQFYSNGWGGFDTAPPAFGGSFAARVEINSVASNSQLYQYNLPLEPNQKYRLYFAAKSNDDQNVKIFVHKHDAPYSNYLLEEEDGEIFEPVNLTSTWKQYQLDFTTNSLATDDGRLRFWLAPYATAGTVYWFDNVYLIKVTDGVPDPPPPNPQEVEVPEPGHCDLPVTGNGVDNPGFEASKIAPWKFYTNGQGYALPDSTTFYQCTQSAKVKIQEQGSNVQLFQYGLNLQPNTSYRLRLAAKSSDGRDVRLYLHKHSAPYTNYGLNGLPLDLSPDWQVFVVQFTTTGFSTPVSDGRLRIWLAGSDAPGAQYYFDDVVLVPLEEITITELVSESLDLWSLSWLDRQADESTVTTSQLLTSGYFIDDDDAGREQGAFLPLQRGNMRCAKARPSHSALWPADGRMIEVKIVGAGKPTSLFVTGIWQDEDVGTKVDGVIDGDSALLRAERADGGNGRVYHVTFNASYRDGTICGHEVLVSVPLQQGALDAVRDDGSLADSTLP